MLLGFITTRADDVANWPNVRFRSVQIPYELTVYGQPFTGVKVGTYVDSNSTWLELIDASLSQENVALGPLFVRSRSLDFIIAADAGWAG